MSNLTEIAKENGALPLPVSRNEQQYILTEAQLQATVEQVCKPLVDALLKISSSGDGVYQWSMTKAELTAHSAIEAHEKLMGQHDL